MKNPLNKRIFSEIKCDKGRYIAIFLFLILAIGFISGFIIADSSMIEEVNKSDEKYNIENGNFEIYGNTVTSLRMRNRKKNGQIISHLNSVKQPLLQSTFQSIPIRQSCSQEMIWVETRCLYNSFCIL